MLEKVTYGGWPNCCRLSNKIVEAIVTTDVGPRIIRFGFIGEENEFAEFKDQLGKTGGEEWRIYGGHRFWHAPEAKPRTYFPDNQPVKTEWNGNTLCLIQPTEPTTGLQKELEITLAPDVAHVVVVHRLWNRGLWTVEVAPWALSVMAQGGRAILPLPAKVAHEEALLPVCPLVLWAYTDMSDPRWHWGERYIVLRQDPQISSPQKVGLGSKEGWIAYAREDHLFIKRFVYQSNANYPDFGCSVETYTNESMLEVETLGPLTELQPGAFVEHVEHWFLFKDVTVGEDEADIERAIRPKLKETEQLVK